GSAPGHTGPSSPSGTALIKARVAAGRPRKESRRAGIDASSGMKSPWRRSSEEVSSPGRFASVAVSVAAAAAGWGWFEAGWLRRRVLELELQGLPAELDGLRIAHLSDFHLGVPS